MWELPSVLPLHSPFLGYSHKTNNKYQLQCSQHQGLKKIHNTLPDILRMKIISQFSWLPTILYQTFQLQFHQPNHRKDWAVSTSWIETNTRMTSSIATVNRVAIQVIIGFNTNPLLSREGKAHSFFGSLVPVWLLIQNIVIDQFTLWRSYPQGQEHSLSKQECRLTKSMQMQTQI